MRTRPLRFDIISIFPGAFSSYLNESLVKRAREERIIDVRLHNLRAFGFGKRKTLDARPFGGGPGMVLQVEPIYRAVQATRVRTPRVKRRVVLFSTRGAPLTSRIAQRLSKYDQLVLICGRYEGVDERVATHIADEEISIGDYVLSGGELPALVLLEAVSRFRKGFLGTHESLETIKGSYPAYTRPASFKPSSRAKSWDVPHDLRSGDHAQIAAWRKRIP